MGHLNRTRKNLRSTQPIISLSNPLSPPTTSEPIHIQIYKPTLTNYTDATGTVLGSDLHFLILYHFDTNYLSAIPLVSYSAAIYLRAYNSALEMYAKARPDKSFIPTYEKADNAITASFVSHLKKQNIVCQLAPPHNHRSNAAERAIQTFKNHFIAGLATCDPDFPISQIKELIPQCLLTLNLLRKSRLSDLPAQIEMHGPFDSNAQSLHPPGCRVVTLDAPSDRKSFAPHGAIAFYLGPASNHYRCWRVFVPSTSSIRTTDSVDWLPTIPIIPKYNTLPPALFNNLPTPIDSSNSHRPILTITAPVNNPEGDITITDTPVNIIPPCIPDSLPPPSPKSVTFHNPSPSPTITTPIILPHSANSEGAFINLQPHITTQPITDGNILPLEHSAFYVHYEKAIRGPDYATWQTSMDTEMHRLITKTGSMSLKIDNIVPPGAKVAFGNPIIKSKLDPLDHSKIIEYRTRLTWGKVNNPTNHITTSSTIDTTAVKLFLNSVVSDPKAIVSTVDISDFYLNSKLKSPAYLKVPLRFLPPITRSWLQVDHLPNDSTILFEVYNAIYGMDDAGRVSQLDLIEHLTPHGYHMCRHTPGLFYHDTRHSFRFATWVDDFIIKSDPSTDDLSHFITILRQKYPIKFEPTAKSYIGYHIQLKRFLDHSLDTLTIDMVDYATSGLQALAFRQTSKPNSPIIYTPPVYGSTIQLAPIDDSPAATSEDQTYLRQAIGIFRYYADAIDSTLSLALSKLAVQQEEPTVTTMAKLDRILNYIATFPDATIIFRPSNMQLAVHSDESYLSEPKARSRSAGFSTCGPIIYQPDSSSNSVNGPIRTTTTVIPTVVSSATEASYAALFINAQNATIDRQTLADLGHPQQSTILTYDNHPAGSIANRTAKVKRSKAIDMRYHWIQDRIEMGHFTITWAPGPHNLADFPSKAHPIHHFLTIRPYFVTYPSGNSSSNTQPDERVC